MTHSLRKNRDFVRVYQRGRKIGTRYLVLFVCKSRLPYNRLGLVASKKVGGAVLRNRARRIIRAAYFKTEHLLPVGMDLIVVALPGLAAQKSTVLEEYFAGTGRKKLFSALGMEIRPAPNSQVIGS